ncbi:4'-phosphopantetheinyl transferase family protein [Spirulina major]|uniref:4'-phosphopantetheinyl transferase family protein n=1 Tax=Spirulina major TaxID=270636 RepID=UPI0009351EF5|nr:4'-phosphopantetheinyl transferase superfamily protein [Spirulina major]
MAAPIQIWLLNFEAIAPEYDRFFAVLNPAEQHRAHRYHHERDRQQFTLTRGCLRHLLSPCIDRAPQDITFTTTPTGKPELTASPWQFNVTHSGAWGAIALHPHHPVGIDLETLRPLPNALDLARRFFCPAEADAIAALPPAQQEIAFFTLWTRKEAYLKATGAGLTGLKTVEISHTAPPQILALHPPTAPPWSLADLPPLPNLRGAFAIQRQPDAVEYHWLNAIADLSTVIH